MMKVIEYQKTSYQHQVRKHCKWCEFNQTEYCNQGVNESSNNRE